MVDEAKFTVPGARRIVRAVRRVEAQGRAAPLSLPPQIASGSATRWLPCVNISGGTIPAYSCVQFDPGVVVDGVYHPYIAAPLTSTPLAFGLTCGVDAAAGDSVGACVEAGLAKYNAADGTPQPGEMWGPAAGQFELRKGRRGFMVVGIYDSEAKLAFVIRSPAQCHHITLTEDIAAGATGSITLPGGTTVSAKNWSGDVDLSTGDKCLAFEDLQDGIFYLIKSGGGGGGASSVTKLFYGLLYAPLDASALSGSAYNLTSYGTGVGNVAGPVAVENPFNCYGRANAVGVFAYHEGQTAYHVIRTEDMGREETIEAYVYGAFDKDTPRFLVAVIRSYSGYKQPGDQIVVENQEDPFQIGGHPYLFEGEFHAVCRIQWDNKSGLYRAVWVQCPEDPPVEAEGSGMQLFPADESLNAGPSNTEPLYIGGSN